MNPVDIADATFAATLAGMYGELRNNRKWDYVVDPATGAVTGTNERLLIDESTIEQLSTYLHTYMPEAFNEVPDGAMFVDSYGDLLSEYATWAELISDARDF